MPRSTSLSHPLLEFLENEDGSRVPQRLAEQSTLPLSDLYRDSAYHGRDPIDVGTSRLVNGTGISTDASLPGLAGSLVSIKTSSIPSSVGERAADDSFRGIVEEPGGNNQVYNDLHLYPPLRRSQVPSLQCPFNLLPCLVVFSMSHINEWIRHSLEHFVTDERIPKRVEPPTSNACPLCPETFFHPSGITSWTNRMRHVAIHHEIGYTLSHGRPDFALFAHLWQNMVIDKQAFRELWGNVADPPHWMLERDSPSMSAGSTSITDDDRGKAPRTICTLNERPRPRRPRHQ